MRERARARLRALARGLSREDGYSAAPIVIPAILLLVFAGVQGAIWYQGASVAQVAADAAYDAARSFDAAPNAGQLAGERMLAELDGYLDGGAVRIERTATDVTVTVSGTPRIIVLGLPLPAIERTITGPIERWVPAS